MELEQYINQEREIYDSILRYIEVKEESSDEEYKKLIDLFNKRQILEKRSEIIESLQILKSISCNHHRIPNFYSKVEKILDYFLEQLKQTFSNIELLQIFHQDKRIVYYLMTKDIFEHDESFLLVLLKNPFNFTKGKTSSEIQFEKKYDFYFYPEIKKRIQGISFDYYEKEKFHEIDSSDLTDFEKKRENGEDDSYICSLIRNDSIVDFVTYVSKMNYSLSSEIKSSIFETNPFLLQNYPTLIEYAAFYGSIQIYQYLRMNEVDLSQTLWLYAIHGNNPDIIHLLEEDHIKPENDSYYNCFVESVKCHHNSVAQYIKDNYLNENDESFIEVALQYHNYEMLPNEFNDNNILFYACKFNYISIVNILMNNKEDVNKIIKVKPDEILNENNNLNEILKNFLIGHSFILLQKKIIKKLLVFYCHKKN